MTCCSTEGDIKSSSYCEHHCDRLLYLVRALVYLYRVFWQSVVSAVI